MAAFAGSVEGPNETGDMSSDHPSGPYPPNQPGPPVAATGYPPIPSTDPGPYPGQPQPYPGQPSPGQPYPGQPYPGQSYPGQSYPGQSHPGQPYPAAPYVPAAKPDPMPAPGTEYHQFLRNGRNRWWKGALAIACLVVGFLIVSTVLGLIAIGIDVATGRIDPGTLATDSFVITPLVLLSVNLSAASLIPLSMLLQWGFYGQPVRWMHAVRGYFRFDLLKRMALLIVPIFLVYVIGSIFVFPAPPSGAFTAESVALLAVVVLTTPLQAAGEEYGARGLIQRAAGSWVADPRISLPVSTVVSAALFCVAHGAGDGWLIGYYFFFGVAMSIVVWRTGGLEVAALIHTANNMLLFGVAIVMGQDLSAGLDRSEGAGGPWVLLPMFVLAAITALVWWWARRHEIDRTFQPDAVH